MSWELRPADVLIPVAVLAVGVVEVLSVMPAGWGWGIALQSVAAALLVFRRRWPVVTCTTAALLLLWTPWLGPQLDDLATPILFLALLTYSLARWRADLLGVVGLVLLLVMMFFDYLLVDVRAHGFGDVVFVLALVLPPYVLGRIVRTMDEQKRLLAEQAVLLQEQAVRDERDRIARELHDVIAHSVSAMVVQTAAAQDLVATDPRRAAAMLEGVAETGRRALAETGRLLHVIRDDADELGLSPAPGLADVPALVDRLRDGGLDVEARLELAARSVPGGVDVSAYRVVQEALTNALKHGAGPVALSVASDDAQVTIRCTNTDVGHGSGSGLGLLGIAERVGVLGGTVRHGRNDDGRFELDVVIPLGAT